jgi:hypothetical protein
MRQYSLSAATFADATVRPRWRPASTVVRERATGGALTNEITTPTSTGSIRSAVAHDLRGSSWTRRALLVATFAWIAYEWGAGNEAVTPWLIVRVISESSGWTSIVAAAIVGFAFTTCQQFASGMTAAAGFATFEQTARAAWQRLTSRLGRPPSNWNDCSWTARAVVVFTLGTTAVVLVQSVTTGEVGARRHRRVVAQAALLCGLVVGLLAAIAAALADVGRRVSWLETPTEWVLRILGNPLFWIAVVVLVALAGRFGRQRDFSDSSG